MDRSDLAIAFAGLEAPSLGFSDAPGQLGWAAKTGFVAVRLNILQSGMHPRDLDRSARRGLGATLRRHELTLHGADLWIPPDHFTDPDRADRAMAAVIRSVELLDELRSLAGADGPGATVDPSLGCTLPATLPTDMADAIRQVASARRVPVADHGYPMREGPTEELGIGIDPATVLLAETESPAKAVARAGAMAHCIRLSDAAKHGRVEPGAPESRVDLMSFSAAVSVGGSRRAVVLDCRGLQDQAATIGRVLERWPGVLPAL